MKINGITALDYSAGNGMLRMILQGASMEEILSMNTAVVNVATDDGQLIEAYPGYQMCGVQYDVKTGTYTAMLRQGADDPTAAVLAELAARAKGQENAQAATQQAIAELSILIAAGGAAGV